MCPPKCVELPSRTFCIGLVKFMFFLFWVVFYTGLVALIPQYMASDFIWKVWHLYFWLHFSESHTSKWDTKTKHFLPGHFGVTRTPGTLVEARLALAWPIPQETLCHFLRGSMLELIMKSFSCLAVALYIWGWSTPPPVEYHADIRDMLSISIVSMNML